MGDTVVVVVEAERPLFAVGLSPSGNEVVQIAGECGQQREASRSLLTGDTLVVILCEPGQAAVSLYDAWTGLLIQDYWPITVDAATE